jgi:guanylate kinase
MKGRLIIISSPSGGGKGTLIRQLLESVPNVGYSISLTTRQPRFGEDDGKHYEFVSRAEFEERVSNAEFLEFAEVHGNLYGTSLSQTQRMTGEGLDVVLEIDVQGAANVREKVPDALSIFILPPSYDVLKARLTARATEGMEDLELRLRNSLDEVMQYRNFDYVVVNDDLATASRKLAAVVMGERQRWNRQDEVIQGILDSFARAKVYRPES